MGKDGQSTDEWNGEGRSILLKRLLLEKGVKSLEIEKLYSTGLMDPEKLSNLTSDELVAASGIDMEFVEIIKSAVSSTDLNQPIECKKIEIEDAKKDIEDILAKIKEVQNEIEGIKNEQDSLDVELQAEHNENEKLLNEIKGLEEVQTTLYFDEKRVQDEVLFAIKEYEEVKVVVDKCAENLSVSKKELSALTKEFLFTKGECEHIMEKAEYLVNRHNLVIREKGDSQTKLTSFLNELTCVHDRLVDANKKSRVDYYAKKQ